MLAVMISAGVLTTQQSTEYAMRLLNRIAPETMTQQEVARRWPRVLASLIVESGGYFTPGSAANALLSYRLGRPFGCEYYCMLAGFERDGWPFDHAVYDRKLREAGRTQLRRATSCDVHCVRTGHCQGRHKASGSRSIGRPGSRELALRLVQEYASGTRDAMLASWF